MKARSKKLLLLITLSSMLFGGHLQARDTSYSGVNPFRRYSACMVSAIVAVCLISYFGVDQAYDYIDQKNAQDALNILENRWKEAEKLEKDAQLLEETGQIEEAAARYLSAANAYSLSMFHIAKVPQNPHTQKTLFDNPDVAKQFRNVCSLSCELYKKAQELYEDAGNAAEAKYAGIAKRCLHDIHDMHNMYPDKPAHEVWTGALDKIETALIAAKVHPGRVY